MIINTKDFKAVCNPLISAINGNDNSLGNLIELQSTGTDLVINMTNREYFLSILFPVDYPEDLHAVVSADLFLKLVSTLKCDTFELVVNENYLEVKSHGVYKLPMVYMNDELMELKTIEIKNRTLETFIKSSDLQSIYHYNAREISKSSAAKMVQKLYYLDNHGCITFSLGACVNNFESSTSFKLLLKPNLVKLFKLFNDENVKVTIGYDAISDDLIQTKVMFETPNIILTAITGCDDTLLNKYPVAKIRERANKEYTYTCVVNKDNLIGVFNRMQLFNVDTLIFKFKGDTLEISDSDFNNVETLQLQSNHENIEGMFKINLEILKDVIDNCNDRYISLNFGDDEALMIMHNNIKDVVMLEEYEY